MTNRYCGRIDVFELEITSGNCTLKTTFKVFTQSLLFNEVSKLQKRTNLFCNLQQVFRIK